MASNYLEEFEKLNTTTESIYDLGDLEVLIILNDGTNLTSWDDVEWEIGVDEFLHDYKYNENIMYVSEDLSKYNDLRKKYERLKSLKAIVAFNVSDKVTNMDFMFKGCEKLVEISSLKLWNVSNVEYMRRMFAGCSSLVDLSGLKGWDVSNVTSMSSMFVGCSSLVDLSGLDDWDVSGVGDMGGMFAGCSSLVDLFVLKDWDVSNVASMSSMFADCSSFADLFALMDWNVSNVEMMMFMFEGCSSLVDLSGLKGWDVSNVEFMRDMFGDCSSLVDLSGLDDWDVSGVGDMGGMFAGCSSLVDLFALKDWDVSNVISMSSMFVGCSSLVDLFALKGWDVSNVKFMRDMFRDCSSLVDASCLNEWDLSNIQEIYGMFDNNTSLKQKPKFVEPMKIMFVCTANTCRSVMAEAIFKQLCKNVDVYSSGIFTQNGKKPSKNTIEVCKFHGMDVSGHNAIYFKDSNIAEMDLVLTLEMLHKHKIKIHYPDLDVYTIREFIDEYPYDINDPFGGSYEVYMECFNEIYHALEIVKSSICTDNEDKILSFKVINQITDDNLLKDIFLSHDDLRIKKEAIRKIKSEQILLELIDVSEFPLTSMIIENMSNKECLANITFNSEYPFNQKIAIRRIDDDEVLAKIALNHENERMRCLAINKLPQDHKVLSKIALNDPFDMARFMAVKKFDNPEILSRIALKDSCEDVRKEAIIKIKDNDILKEFINKESLSYLKEIAIKNLTNENYLN